jgi:hypothetical protein
MKSVYSALSVNQLTALKIKEKMSALQPPVLYIDVFSGGLDLFIFSCAAAAACQRQRSKGACRSCLPAGGKPARRRKSVKHLSPDSESPIN